MMPRQAKEAEAMVPSLQEVAFKCKPESACMAPIFLWPGQSPQ